ncbi:CoA-binding protein [Halalkalibaculum sp. DA3122]|uniref:CoA-binding protein n=1 Tax=unclassified Halalkalibaculum TaxID=2964617 RepID=UPI003754655D
MERSIADILNSAETIAIIGCSTDPYRTSHHIARYLKDQGYQIIPVNPEYEEVLGEKCYPKLTDIPKEQRIDVVDIFRNSAYTAEMVDTVIDRVQQTGHKPVVWTQLGVSSGEAKQKAASAGLQYIEERCLMVEHRAVSTGADQDH